MLGLAVLVVVVGGVIAFLWRDPGAGDAPGDDDGGSALRRVFVYAVALLGAVLTASGMSSMLRVLLESLTGTPLVLTDGRGLALGLSLTIVGSPVWVLAWLAAERAVERDTAERTALPRRLHLAAIRTVALAVAVPAAIDAGEWLAAAGPTDPSAVARLIGWGITWALHEHLASSEHRFGSPDTHRIDRLFVYATAASGLWLAGAATASALGRALDQLYGAAGTPLLVTSRLTAIELRTAAVTVAIGGALWARYWIALARRDAGSRAWLSYVFIAGVLAGLATAITSGSVLLHRVVAWMIGAATEPAMRHFAVAPTAIAAAVVGIAIWGYHRAALRELDDPSAVGGAERGHRYVLAAAGMLTTATGIATIVGIGIDLLLPGRPLVGAPTGVRDAVAIGLTLLLIGVPLWAVHWSQVQERVRRDPAERTTVARRALILGAFGAATVVAVVAASVLLYELFDAVLGGALSATLVEEQRWSIAVLLTAGAVSVHYGLVAREDRDVAPPRERRPALREVVVVAADGSLIGDMLRRRLDIRVTVWDRADTDTADTSDDDVDALVHDLTLLEVPRALVLVPGDGGFEVVPLRRP